MAERMEAAQINQSELALKYHHKDTFRGHWLGFGLSALAMIGAGLMAYLGQSWLAAAFLSVPVMGVAKALVEKAIPLKNG